MSDKQIIIELMNFLKSDQGINSELSQEIKNAHLFCHITMLSVFALIFVINVAVARNANHRTDVTRKQIDQIKAISATIAFFAFLAGVHSLYNMAQVFLFPRVIVLREVARIFQ